MRKLKNTAKKVFAGILAAAMALTTGYFPDGVTTAQAAEVYNDTTTALSALAGSTGLKIYRLTSDDAGKELTSGIYYVDEDLTFTGADSTSSSSAGGNGLKIADGATVYIYIADGKTLTATGGNGYAGTDGKNGTTGSINIVTDNVKGITFTKGKYSENGAGGAGGSGASGGGAAIYVPNGSKIAILGKGSVNATGGAGGNAGNGQTGQKTLYYNLSWQAPSYNSSVTRSSTTNNIGLATSFSGANTNNGQYSFNSNVVIGGAGGSGGGGAAGGGAGIGTNGANGNVGANGVTGNYDSNNNDYIDKVAGSSATANIAANSSGQIYIGNVAVNATGGIGGQAGSQQAVVDKHKHGITYYIKGSSSANSGNFWVQDGQSGGGGGAGGTGASIGTGGQGGQGGAGGDAGSCWTKDPFSDKSGYAPESVRGANGASGANGTGSSSALSDSQYPYNTITFTKAKSNATQNYYITKQTQITVPNYETTQTGEHFYGWKVTTPATALPSAFKEDACGLEEEGKVYQPDETITATGVYGNVTVDPLILTVTGADKTINYTPEYDLSQLFAIDENAGAQTYKVEAQGDAKGTVSGHTLNIQKCGTFKVTLKTAKNGDYGTTETTATLKVNIKTITPTVSVAGWTYGSYEKETNAPKLEGNTGNAKVTYTYYIDAAFSEKTTPENSGAKTEGGVPVNAGTYYVQADVEATGNTSKATAKSSAFTIAQKTITNEMVAAEKTALEYNGEEQTLAYSVKDADNKKLEKDKDYTVSGKESATDIGSYRLTLTGTGNYTGTVTLDWKITHLQMKDVQAQGYNGTYDGKEHSIKVSVKTPSDAEITYSTEENGTYTEENPKYKDAGTHTVWYQIEKNAYETVRGSETVEIAKKEISAVITAEGKTYDGTTDCGNITAEVATGVDGESITITGLKGTFADKKAGADKTVRISEENKQIAYDGGAKEENYTIAIPETVTAAIEKKSIKVTATATDCDYDGTKNVAVEGTLAADSGVLAGDQVTVAGGTGVMADANAGEHKAVTVTGMNLSGTDAENYEVTEVPETTVTISKKSVTLTPENKEKHKGKADPELTYKAEGVVAGETLKDVTVERETGEDARTYEITVKVKEGSNPNYDITISEAKGTFTIEDHKWPDTWTVSKEATDTEEGERYKECTVAGCGQKRFQSIPKTGTTDPGNGNLEKAAEVAADAPIEKAALNNSIESLLTDTKIFTPEEQTAIKNGTSANTWVEITKTDESRLSDQNKTDVTNAAKKSLGSKAQVEYFDADYFKQLSTETEKTKITETTVPITISIVIPDDLLKHDANMVRSYKMIRLHEGKVDEIGGTFDEKTSTFTFETTQFSTYAIAYADKPKNSGSGSSSSGNSGNTIPAKPTIKITTATSEGGKITASKTGDITKGDTVTYTITPADGYEIKDVLVDGKSVGAVTSYTFTNVTEKHTISAVFAKKNAQEPQKPDDTGKDDNKNNVTDQSKLNGNQVSKLKLPILLAKGKGGKKQITLSWLKVKDADGYEAYWSYCDGGKNYKKFATVKNGKLTVTQKKLKNSEKYKYFVVAYKMVDGKKVYIAKSNYLHVAMLDNRQTNAKSVSVNKTDVVLTKKQTFTIQAKIRLENGKKKPLLHTAEFRYYTTDAKVAKVNRDGVITAKGTGSCTVYVLANNGVYKKIKVTVK